MTNSEVLDSFSFSPFYPGLNLSTLKRKIDDYFNWKGELIHWKGPWTVHKDFWITLKKIIKEGHPLEYFFKQKFFYESLFYIDENVLIPRNETETLVDYSQKFVKGRVLDLCTGSGCVGLSLAQLKGCEEVILSDISIEALNIAEVNLFRHSFKLLGKTYCCQSDLFENLSGRFDLIVSNPPYIIQKNHVHPQVAQFEPKLALYTDLEWLKKLFLGVEKHLKMKGNFIMEGDEQSESLYEELADKAGLSHICSVKDLTNRLRVYHFQKIKGE